MGFGIVSVKEERALIYLKKAAALVLILSFYQSGVNVNLNLILAFIYYSGGNWQQRKGHIEANQLLCK